MKPIYFRSMVYGIAGRMEKRSAGHLSPTRAFTPVDG